MIANSNLEVLVNLGLDKEEASAALKQGNFNNNLNTLLNDVKSKYYFVIKSSENKKSERKFESKNLRKYGTPVGLKKCDEGIYKD